MGCFALRRGRAKPPAGWQGNRPARVRKYLPPASDCGRWVNSHQFVLHAVKDAVDELAAVGVPAVIGSKLVSTNPVGWAPVFPPHPPWAWNSYRYDRFTGSMSTESETSSGSSKVSVSFARWRLRAVICRVRSMI